MTDREVQVRTLGEQVGVRAISRREFVTRATALGLSASAISAILSACGGEDEEATNGAETAPRPTDGSDEIAVNAAKKFRGTTLNITWESGLQAIDPKEVWGREWEDLTEISVNVAELDHADNYTKAIAEHIARSGAFDILSIEPAWIPDLVLGGVIEPVDEFVEMYYSPADLDDYHPLYKGMATYQGKRWGFFDDGDVLILYYRKDLFAELGLSVPTTWDEFRQTAQQITDEMAPRMWGADFWRNPGFQHWPFLMQFYAQEGQPFDPGTMNATINSDIGVRSIEQLLAENRVAPPGVLEHDPVTVLNSWLKGEVAMMYWWPPAGRWSGGYVGAAEQGFEFVAKSEIVDKVGYAVVPGGVTQHASGWHLAVAADSKNKEAAYLTLQWITSPKISLKRVIQPTTFRDPYRLSHFKSGEYRGLWADAGAYLDTLDEAANFAVTDIAIPGWQDYALALDKAVTSAYGGSDPKQALDGAAAEWNRITDRLGREEQIEAYNAFLELPGSSLDKRIAPGS